MRMDLRCVVRWECRGVKVVVDWSQVKQEFNPSTMDPAAGGVPIARICGDVFGVAWAVLHTLLRSQQLLRSIVCWG